jgi:signal transduction histidine kinase
MEPGRISEERLVARARRIITAQIAATVTFLALLAGGVTLIVVTHNQSASEQRELAMSAARPMVRHPMAHTWEFQQTDGALTGTPGAPSYLPVRAPLDQAAARQVTLVAGYQIDGIDYLIRTQPVGDTVIQVALDLRPEETQRDELYLAFALFEVVGLAAAVAAGRLLSRRAVAPFSAAIERQTRFVADASHELRTPLSQLHSRAQLLQHRLSRDSQVTLTQRELDEILASTRQFGEVIEDVLQSAQLRHEPQLRAPVDLSVVVTEVAAAESGRADQAGISIAVCPDPGSAGLVVSGVGPALRRAIGALVDNALTHTPHGGHIDIRITGTPHSVSISVRDDGVGFPADDAERIFDRSRHSEGSGHDGHGTGQRFGIGLALVREIIVSHGGTITAFGQPGAGAKFTITLPRGAAPPAQVRPRRKGYHRAKPVRRLMWAPAMWRKG